ncbi:glucokinase, partial [Spiribacter roseus]|uniref:glucokinase n=1 Tax=Spiribacter roseus TaxID=1855875 RepID=UPI001F461C7C
MLVADIGGTHARAGLVTEPGRAPARIFRRPTRSFNGLAGFLAAARDDLAPHPAPLRAVCAVASPLDDDPVELTNAGWRFSPQAVASDLGLAPRSYTHLRAHETTLQLVSRLLLDQNNH